MINKFLNVACVLLVGVCLATCYNKSLHKRTWMRFYQPNLKTTTPLRFTKAAVAADSKTCSSIGVNIIKKGGNAADAYITTHCCTEIVNSHSTGLGGGGFVLYYNRKTGKSEVFDFRETLPSNSPKFFINETLRKGQQILIPGVLKGLFLLWKKFGSKKISWRKLWEPCIKLAQDGVTIGAALSNAINQMSFIDDISLRSLLEPNGSKLLYGEIIKRPLLAKTFKMISKSQDDSIFYKGKIAQQIIKDVNVNGGFITLKDLGNYRVVTRKPLVIKFRNLTVLTTPAPSGGSLVLHALTIIDKFNWTRKDLDQNPALIYHKLIEAFKFSYGPYTFLQDPKFSSTVSQVESYMVDPLIVLKHFRLIDNVSHPFSYYGPYNEITPFNKQGTTHISIIDNLGNAISGTTSINNYFGAGIMSPELGIIYNNDGTEFHKDWRNQYSIRPDDPHPGKRPLSQMSPIIILNERGDVAGVFGAAGGRFIPTSLVQVIVNWLFFQDNIRVAISRPRLHCQLFPPTVDVEERFSSKLLNSIMRYQGVYYNSTKIVTDEIMGVIQAIVRSDGALHADSDYRKGGNSAGL